MASDPEEIADNLRVDEANLEGPEGEAMADRLVRDLLPGYGFAPPSGALHRLAVRLVQAALLEGVRRSQQRLAGRVFGAVRPATGEGFALVLPEVSTAATATFLERFAATRGRDAHVVAACAACSRSDISPRGEAFLPRPRARSVAYTLAAE